MRIETEGLPTFTLGWELEATGRARRALPGVEVGHDGSVNGDAVEYRVKRSLVFTPNASLDALRNLTMDPFLKIDSSCGFHVHVGLGHRTHKLHAWAAWFVTLAREIEPFAFEAVPPSRRHNSYCKMWKAFSTESVLTKRYDQSKGSNPARYNWINPVEIFRPRGIRTIEVRLMGDSKRYSYLLAWISACRLMAFSAWALTSDPSRLEFEKAQLIKVFQLLKDNFLASGVPSRDVASAALYLSTKALLKEPFGKPLMKLADAEKDLLYKERLSASEKSQCDMWIKRLESDSSAYRARVRSGALPPSGAIVPGDTAQCVRVPDDGGLTLGRFYRVQEASNGGLSVLNDTARHWYITPDCVRLVERGSLCVA